MNTEVYERALTHIEAHPDQHNQASWRCGSGMCFAGWIGELADGVRWYDPDPDNSRTSYLVVVDPSKVWGIEYTALLHYGPNVYPIDTIAGHLLGGEIITNLTPDEASRLSDGIIEGDNFHLFSAFITREQLRTAFEIIKERQA